MDWMGRESYPSRVKKTNGYFEEAFGFGTKTVCPQSSWSPFISHFESSPNIASTSCLVSWAEFLHPEATLIVRGVQTEGTCEFHNMVLNIFVFSPMPRSWSWLVLAVGF